MNNRRVVFQQFMLLATLCCIAPLPQQTYGQAVPYAGTFPQSKDKVDHALKELQAYAGQKLPIVEGFVAAGDKPLNRYERGFYQFSIDLLPGPAGGTIVRITAKITAWYADRDPSKSGYEVLPSNGRLELDLLDRLTEEFGGKSSGSISRSGIQAPKPKLDLSTGLPGRSLPVSESSVRAPTPSAVPDSSMAETAEVTSLRVKREAEEKRAQQLNVELQNLQEIQRNQAHPLNIVVVKKAGIPILVHPTEGSQVLFTASANDEFEFLDGEREWIHVQISGASRGYIRRHNLELPDSIAEHLRFPNGIGSEGTFQGFRVEREEIGPFPGDWEALRGKPVKIYTVLPASGNSQGTGAREKLNFASFLFRKFPADSEPAKPPIEGIVVIFDSADGGIIGSTLSSVKQLAAGSLSADNFWNQCYLDPPDAFQPRLKP